MPSNCAWNSLFLQADKSHIADVCFECYSAGVFLFFVFLGLATLLVQLIVEIALAVRVLLMERSIEAIRVQSSGRLPRLTLQEGQRFHLFLSHVWKTAQVTTIPSRHLPPSSALGVDPIGSALCAALSRIKWLSSSVSSSSCYRA